MLQARQSYVNRVLEEALEHLVKATKDEEMYKKVLQKLIEQVNSPSRLLLLSFGFEATD